MKTFGNDNTNDTNNSEDAQLESAKDRLIRGVEVSGEIPDLSGFNINYLAILTADDEVTAEGLDACGLNTTCGCAREGCDAPATPPEYDKVRVAASSAELIARHADEETASRNFDMLVDAVKVITGGDIETVISLLVYALNRSNGMERALAKLMKND